MQVVSDRSMFFGQSRRGWPCGQAHRYDGRRSSSSAWGGQGEVAYHHAVLHGQLCCPWRLCCEAPCHRFLSNCLGLTSPNGQWHCWHSHRSNLTDAARRCRNLLGTKWTARCPARGQSVSGPTNALCNATGTNYSIGIALK